VFVTATSPRAAIGPRRAFKLEALL